MDNPSTIDEIGECVVKLVEKARDLGYVVTVETVPKKPLAMGNYGMEVVVRENNFAYRFRAAAKEQS